MVNSSSIKWGLYGLRSIPEKPLITEPAFHVLSTTNVVFLALAVLYIVFGMFGPFVE